MKYDILVNKNNLIEEDYIESIKLEITKNIYDENIFVEYKTFQNYNKMKEYLRSKNIFIEIDSSYRSLKEQENVIKEFTEKYGKEYTEKLVAKTGTSEHHTGLAIDLCLIVNGIKILENEDLVKEVDIWNVIHKELHKFGFILRYPQGKENITGYNYEPWHIRYVGKELAEVIYNQNITLEEYHEMNKFKYY